MISWGSLGPLLFLGLGLRILLVPSGWSTRRREEVRVSAAELLVEMQSRQAPALVMRAARTGTASGFAGGTGHPARPRSDRRDGKALLLWVDLVEVRKTGGPPWLPGEGVLEVFADDSLGEAEQVSIVVTGADRLGGDPGDDAAEGSPGLGMTFAPFTSLPSLDWLGIDEVDGKRDDPAWRDLRALAGSPPPEGPRHLLGGYPEELQPGRMGIECEYAARGTDSPGRLIPPDILEASKSWRLLVQIDSDPAVGWRWGDGGRLYVFIREQDAREGRFDRTVTIFQTH